MTFLPSVNPVRSELLWVCAAARKRSKWLPTNKHPSRSPSPSSVSAIPPNAAPGQGCQQQPLFKSCWPQTLSQDDSFLTSQKTHAFQGVFPQPLVQRRAGPGLIPLSPFVKTSRHPNDEASLHDQKHQSLLSLLGQ